MLLVQPTACLTSDPLQRTTPSAQQQQQQQHKHHHKHHHKQQQPKQQYVLDATSNNRCDYYYAKCLVGGGLSSSLRWALTPLDYIKCSMQAHPKRFSSFSSGLAFVYTKQGLSGLYRGFTPTVLAYFSQSGCKYAMYELLKDQFAQALGEERAAEHKTLVYAVAAGSAEAVADVAMCPWEMLKIQVQTAGCEKSFPSRFGPALKSMLEQRRALNFPFGSLGPLWSRQVVGTMANFVAFEHTVNWIYATTSRCWNTDKQDCAKSTQLAVSFVAGFCSGVVSATVSHPADSLLSLRARFPEATYTEIVNSVGWNKLATQGLFPRAALTGTIIAGQWFLYDSFKTVVGLGTTGG
mmetsp:Transcript_25127/g.55099  ORF Transcript_25127/g.55099 Transcript_25127/m.55099 type:complete len:351 (-) Transcript_25127:403-1455(-)